MDNKILEKVYKNGKYVGEIFQDARLGNGTMYFNDGCVYEGEWFFDYMSGKGSFTWPSGDKYVGDFLNNYRTGEGIYYFGEGKWQGDRYEGEFLNDYRHGFGIYYKANGEIIYGKWDEGKLIDKYENKQAYENAINPPFIPIYKKEFPKVVESFDVKVINYSNGGKYYGNVNVDRKPDGYGLMIWDDFTCYIGEFKNNQMDGYGIVFYEDGTVHMGKFENANYKGYAASIDEDYALFAEYDHFDVKKEIAYRKNLKVEFNTEILEFKQMLDGHYEYIGETKDNKYHGLGVLDGTLSTYIGQFKDGLACGIGIKIVNNSEIYIGQFKNDCFNGYGMHIAFDGKIKFGNWENNVFVGRN